VLLVVDYHEVTQLETQGRGHLNMAIEQAYSDVMSSQTNCSGEVTVPFEEVSASSLIEAHIVLLPSVVGLHKDHSWIRTLVNEAVNPSNHSPRTGDRSKVVSMYYFSTTLWVCRSSDPVRR
jgi:hypothetical protein